MWVIKYVNNESLISQMLDLTFHNLSHPMFPKPHSMSDYSPTPRKARLRASLSSFFTLCSTYFSFGSFSIFC